MNVFSGNENRRQKLCEQIINFLVSQRYLKKFIQRIQILFTQTVTKLLKFISIRCKKSRRVVTRPRSFTNGFLTHYIPMELLSLVNKEEKAWEKET